MSSEPLRPVYLLTGSDRPKQLRALHRLRAHFGAEAVEQLSADSASGADAVAACNALGLFGEGSGQLVIVHGAERWRKADVDAIGVYLGDPVEGTVLTLIAEELPKGSALFGLVERHGGQVLRYEVPKPASLHGWVHKELSRLGVTADADAARALVELVGEDTIALAGEVEKLAAWADGDPVTRKEVEQLAAPGREAAAWALSDAWGARDLPALLAACDLALEKKEPFLLAVSLASHVGRVRAAQALAEEGLGARDVAARLKMKDFPARKALQHAERYSRDELDCALVRLAELDAAIKGASRLSAELELVRALIDVTRPAAQAAAPTA
jgi:DNA polymerase III subunit delta